MSFAILGIVLVPLMGRHAHRMVAARMTPDEVGMQGNYAR
jgi:hypothetical protein